MEQETVDENTALRRAVLGMKAGASAAVNMADGANSVVFGGGINSVSSSNCNGAGSYAQMIRMSISQ